jgi:hypothetical protein
MILFFILFLKLIATETDTESETVNAPTVQPQEIPIVSESKNTCPCSRERTNVCRGGVYVDYYYNAPYSGYPKDSSYLPPVESIPVIVTELTSIRDMVKKFIKKVNKKESNNKKALYVKDNYSKVHYLLQAVEKAARKAKSKEAIIND